MSENSFWIVMVVLPFSSLDMDNSLGVTFEIKVGKDGPTYFCPVFESETEANKWSAGKYAVLPLTQTDKDKLIH